MLQLVFYQEQIYLDKMTARTPGTPASKVDRTQAATPGGNRAKEEKIVVTVRLRPLSKREQLSKDQIAWDCTDDHTIAYNTSPNERVVLPVSFTFGNHHAGTRFGCPVV